MKSAKAPTTGTIVLDQLLVRQCAAMAGFALASGLPVPAAVLQALQPLPGATTTAELAPEEVGTGPGLDLDRLAWAHSQLSALIAPATPRAVLLLAEHRDPHGAWNPFGAVRLVRHLLLLALVSLAAFIGLALSPDVHYGAGDIFSSSGLDLLVNELFFLSAASLGAAFAALFKVNGYVAACTYDPKFESSYWVRYTLGLIAGILLAGLIPVDQGSAAPPLSRPLLALLGGFSSAILYEVLDRLTQTVESMVQATTGSPRSGQERAERRAARSSEDGLEHAAGAEPQQAREELGGRPRLATPPSAIPTDREGGPASPNSVGAAHP